MDPSPLLDEGGAAPREETPHQTAARLISVFLEETRVSTAGLSFQWANGEDREGCFTVGFWLVPGPYDVFAHIPDPPEDPHELAIKALEIFEQSPSHWPCVEWLERYDAPDRGPDIAGPGWRRRES